MTRACPAFEPLLLDRAAGAIDAVDRARLERHLETCAPCRAEAADVERALSLAALPPLPDAEREAVARGGREALLRHRSGRRRLAGGLVLAIAASAAFAVAVPWYLLSRHAAPPPQEASTGVAWELPDLDAVWAATDLSDSDAAAEPSEVLFAELQEVDLDPQ
ncbi:MAG: zf-HC2 domain-containing protein [Deltaproteobacteria bacterium]